MLQAITPGDDVFDFRYNLQKKSDVFQNKYQKVSYLPVIKTFKDQMTATEDIRTCIDFNMKQNRNVNETTLLLNLINKNSSMTSVTNMITNNSNVISSKLLFNRNIKLKGIQKPLMKSNSTANMNKITSKKSLAVLSFPGKLPEKKYLKHSSSLPKLNINQEYFENNKCNYLVLKYTGIDNSKNEIKKKKYLVINSHKVINSLKSYSMPNDIYGTKLIDIIQQRINSGFYRNYKLNFNYSQKYQSVQVSSNTQYDLKKKENKKEEKKFSGTFMKDIYDNFLLPGPDNKYNYTVHKIFLSQIMEKVFKKMVEIRDKKNAVITKEEIRKEYSKEVDNLKQTLLTGKDFKVINNIYNINNSLNIISIDLDRIHKFNEMGVIDESQERDLLSKSLEGSDKDRQSMTSNLFNTVNKTIHDEQSRKDNLEKMETNYKIIHKEENTKLQSYIKDTIQIPNKNITIHDSFLNLYFNRIKSAKHENQIFSNNKFSNGQLISSFTATRQYFQQEDDLNNVDKFILNTKKLRYTLNIREKTWDKERNHSIDSEGNVKNYFDEGLKLNPVFFDDIYDELQEQYNKNNNIDKKIAQNDMIKEILRYYLHKKGVNLKFNDKISKKYLSMLLPKQKKTVKRAKKIKDKLTIKKKEIHLIKDIGKKIHKKISIKKRRIIIDSTEEKRKKNKNRRNNTEDNFYQKNQSILKDKEIIKIKKDERQFTENNYLEIETNSSEFSDLPSELDSEIFEMIKKKKEKEKNKIKDMEEGIYADKSGNKQKGGDFIISRPIDKEIQKKEKEEEKKALEKEKEEEKKDENNNLGNLNMFLNVNEKGELEVDKSKKKTEDKKTNANLQKKSPTQKQIEQKPKTNVSLFQKFQDIKLKPDNIPKKDNKSNSNINISGDTEKNKDKKDDSFTKITPKGPMKNKEVKPTKKINQKELEKITEEENKDTNLSNKLREESKKPKQTNVLPKNNRKEKPVVSLYKNIKIEKKGSSDKGANEDISEKSNNNDIKNLVPSLEDKNNINESSVNPTTDHLSIMGVLNTINLKEKTLTNNSKIQKNKKKSLEEEFEDEDEEIDADIMKAKMKKNSTFYNYKNKRMRLENIEIEENGKGRSKRGNSASLDSTKNYIKLKYFLDKYDEENKKGEEDDYKLNFFDDKSIDLEEDEKQKEERRKRKMKKKTKNKKNKDFRKFFIDENIDKEEKKKKTPEKELEIENKKDIWEEKFKKFKLYIHKLKGMNQEEFKYDLFKFLDEDEKIDFTQKEKLNKVDRINKYKAFISNSKLNKLKYNRFHSSHILFTPGCIFNTGGLFPE